MILYSDFIFLWNSTRKSAFLTGNSDNLFSVGALLGLYMAFDTAWTLYWNSFLPLLLFSGVLSLRAAGLVYLLLPQFCPLLTPHCLLESPSIFTCSITVIRQNPQTWNLNCPLSSRSKSQMSDRHFPLDVLPIPQFKMSKTKLIFLTLLFFPLSLFCFQYFQHILPIWKTHLSLICPYFIHTAQRLLYLINSINFISIVVCIVHRFLSIFNIIQLAQAPVTFSQ